MDLNGQLLMPWAAPMPTPREYVEAATAGVPKEAAHCTPVRAAEVFGCHTRTIYNMVAEGTLMSRNINASHDAKRGHIRIVVRLDRPFDPQRKKFLTLEEAARVRSNVEGIEYLNREKSVAEINKQPSGALGEHALPPKDNP